VRCLDAAVEETKPYQMIQAEQNQFQTNMDFGKDRGMQLEQITAAFSSI